MPVIDAGPDNRVLGQFFDWWLAHPEQLDALEKALEQEMGVEEENLRRMRTTLQRQQAKVAKLQLQKARMTALRETIEEEMDGG